MKFVYIGVAEKTKTLGYSFTKGEPVEIKDEGVIKKLSGNKCFEVHKAKPKAKAKVQPKPDFG